MIKKVVHTVVCAYDHNHIFEKVVEVDIHAVDVRTTNVDTYCPFCHKKVKFRVDGQVIPEKDLLKQFRVIHEYDNEHPG
jgi:hypothetical protein